MCFITFPNDTFVKKAYCKVTVPKIVYTSSGKFCALFGFKTDFSAESLDFSLVPYRLPDCRDCLDYLNCLDKKSEKDQA